MTYLQSANALFICILLCLRCHVRSSPTFVDDGGRLARGFAHFMGKGHDTNTQSAANGLENTKLLSGNGPHSKFYDPTGSTWSKVSQPHKLPNSLSPTLKNPKVLTPVKPAEFTPQELQDIKDFLFHFYRPFIFYGQLHTRPSYIKDVTDFETRWNIAPVDGKLKLLDYLFAALNDRSIQRSTGELEIWAKFLAHLMQVENWSQVQNIKVEVKMQFDLLNLIIENSKYKANSPERTSLESFKSLERTLFQRLEHSISSWIENSEWNWTPWARRESHDSCQVSFVDA
ncbi:hypothetical protein O181_013163 [Austropuccinia psidii MF-1]|uniref:Uncharacterized protein n=1 Tax=Austropuccinia psidii MF-1 TaxID=1389203 RepID=A0A9Q3BY61_9BASI|nr:hypothetical protein [Austropuccinia psidii MF-1]